MNQRFRASYKIAIGFAALALLAIYGYRYTNDYFLGRDHFPPLSPGTVDVVGLDTKKGGYHIIVQERMAKLLLGSGGGFGPGDVKEEEKSDTERVFVPIKEMLKGLQGDIQGLSYFVQRLNDIKDEDLPADAPIWKIEDIRKALADPGALRDRFVRDINENIDGSPLDRISRSALFNGILVDTPVPLQIQRGSTREKVIARVKRPYLSYLVREIQRRISTGNKFMDLQGIAREYATVAELIRSGQAPKENVAASIERFSEDVHKLQGLPQTVLDSVNIVINEDQITGASYQTVQTPKGPIYTLLIDLNDEGKKRLWQFSRDRIGDQLLLTVDGVAISAPYIEHGLASGQVEISGLQDESLVQDAVATINRMRAKTTK